MTIKSYTPLSYEIKSEDRKLIVRGFQDSVDIYDPKDEEGTTLTLDWDEAHELKKVLSNLIKGAQKTYW